MMHRTLYKVTDAWNDRPAVFIFARNPQVAELKAVILWDFVLPCAEIPTFSWEGQEACNRG